jgi:DNA-directed RNA polymerase subunit RPC12/RpoP
MVIGSLFAVQDCMPDANRTELFSLNCGRCGKPLKIQLEALRDKRTVECPECEKKLPARVEDAQHRFRSREDIEPMTISRRCS